MESDKWRELPPPPSPTKSRRVRRPQVPIDDATSALQHVSLSSPVQTARSPPRSPRSPSRLPALGSPAPRLTASGSLLHRDRESIYSETSSYTTDSYTASLEPWSTRSTHLSGTSSMELSSDSEDEDMLDTEEYKAFLFKTDLADDTETVVQQNPVELPSLSIPTIPSSPVRFAKEDVLDDGALPPLPQDIYEELNAAHLPQERKSLLEAQQKSWYAYWGLSEQEGVALRNRIGEREFQLQCQLFEPVFLEVRLSNNIKRAETFQAEFARKKTRLTNFDSQIPETLFEPMLDVYKLHRDYLMLPLIDLVRKQMFIDPDQFADIYFNWYMTSKQEILDYFKKGAKIVSIMVTTRDSPLVQWFDSIDKQHPGGVVGRELFLFYLRTRFGSLNVSLASVAGLLEKRGDARLSTKLMNTKQKLDSLARKGCAYLKLQEDMRAWDNVNFKEFDKVVNIDSPNRRSRGIFPLKRKSHTGWSGCHLGILDNYVVLLRRAKPAGYEVLTRPLAIQRLMVQHTEDETIELSRQNSVISVSTLHSRSSIGGFERDICTFQIYELEDSKKFVLGDPSLANITTVIEHLKKAKELYHKWALKMVKLDVIDTESFAAMGSSSKTVWETNVLLQKVEDKALPSKNMTSKPMAGGIFSFSGATYTVVGCVTGLYVRGPSQVWKKAFEAGPIQKIQTVDEIGRIVFNVATALTSLSYRDLARFADSDSARLPLRSVEIEKKHVRYFTVGHSAGSLKVIEFMDSGMKNIRVYGWDTEKDTPSLLEKMNCRVTGVTGLLCFERFFTLTSAKMGLCLANISSQAMISIPEQEDHMDTSMQGLFARIKESPSIGMFTLSPTEYLLVYEKFATVMSTNLHVKSTKTIEFMFKCRDVAFHPQSKTLVVFGKESVHFYSLRLLPQFGFSLTLVLPAADIVLLNRSQLLFSVASPRQSGNSLILGVGM